MGYRLPEVTMLGFAIELWTRSSYLQLGESEASTSAHTTIVLDSRAAHNRSQSINRTRSDLDSFRNASLTAALLAAGLK